MWKHGDKGFKEWIWKIYNKERKMAEETRNAKKKLEMLIIKKENESSMKEYRRFTIMSVLN